MEQKKTPEYYARRVGRLVSEEDYKVAPLEGDAWEYAQNYTDTSELQQTNVTEGFYRTIFRMRKHELLNMHLLGRTISSKSTTAMQLQDVLAENAGIKVVPPHWVVADMIEWSRQMQDDRNAGCIFVVDEHNKLNTIGANSTTEMTNWEYYTEVQAQRKNHKIGCSPTVITDNLSNIILEVVGKSTEKKSTRVLVYFRFFRNTQDVIQLVGHADIDVGPVLKTDRYLVYRYKKFKRMELRNKEGIKDVRELENAELTYHLIHELEDDARFGFLDKKYIGVKISEWARQHGLLFSLTNHAKTAFDLEGVLSIRTGLAKIDKDRRSIAQTLVKLYNQKGGEIVSNLIRQYEDDLKKLKSIEERKINEWNAEVAKWKRLITINKKYQDIWLQDVTDMDAVREYVERYERLVEEASREQASYERILPQRITRDYADGIVKEETVK